MTIRAQAAESEKPAITCKLLLTPQEAADALAIHRSTLYVLMAQGQIPSIKVNRSRRIKVKDLEQWIDDQLAA